MNHMCSLNNCISGLPYMLKQIKNFLESDSLLEQSSSDELNETNEEKCCICLEAITGQYAYLSVCSHGFCKVCIDKWTLENNSCPLCRTPFPVIIYTENKATKEDVSYLFGQHFICSWLEPIHAVDQKVYSLDELENIIYFMKRGISLENIISSSDLTNVVKQLYKYTHE